MKHRAAVALALAATLTPGIGSAYAPNEGVDFLTLQPTPASSTVVEDCDAHLGWFEDAFRTVNVSSLNFLAPMRRWHFFSFTNSHWVTGMAIVDLGYLSNFFFYMYDMTTGQMLQLDEKMLGTASIAGSSLAGSTTYKSLLSSVTIENHTSETVPYYRVKFSIFTFANGWGTGNVKVYVDSDPLVNVREVDWKRVVYTHQSSVYRPEGTIRWKGKTATFSAASSFATMDYTQGQHLYETDWNWSAAGGIAEDGTEVGINLAADISEGTNNVAVYWIDGQILRAPSVDFAYDDPTGTWTITSPDGAIDLVFTPVAWRSDSTDLLVIAADYTQPIGTYSGTLRGPDGVDHHVHDMVGVAEEHFALW